MNPLFYLSLRQHRSFCLALAHFVSSSPRTPAPPCSASARLPLSAEALTGAAFPWPRSRAQVLGSGSLGTGAPGLATPKQCFPTVWPTPDTRGTFPWTSIRPRASFCPAARPRRWFLHPVRPGVLDDCVPGIAFIAPNIVLTRLVKRRREKIRRSIPDADRSAGHLCRCRVWASTRRCCASVRNSGSAIPQITEELLQINREQRAGKPRIQAWADMA